MSICHKKVCANFIKDKCTLFNEKAYYVPNMDKMRQFWRSILMNVLSLKKQHNKQLCYPSMINTLYVYT